MLDKKESVFSLFEVIFNIYLDFCQMLSNNKNGTKPKIGKRGGEIGLKPVSHLLKVNLAKMWRNCFSQLFKKAIFSAPLQIK